MGKINLKHFEIPDNKDSRYSFIEYDLYAKTGLSIRKNILENRWEIFEISSNKMKYKGTLEYIVERANEIEGAENTFIS